MTPNRKPDHPSPLADALYALRRHGHVSLEQAALLTEAGLAEPDPVDVHTSLGTAFEFEFIRLNPRGADLMGKLLWPQPETSRLEERQKHPEELADIVDRERKHSRLVYTRAILETPAAANIERLYFNSATGWFAGSRMPEPDHVALP